MESYKKTNRYPYLIGAIGLCLFFLLLNSIGIMKPINNVVSKLTIPIRTELHQVTININNYIGAIRRISDMKKENEDLHKANLLLLEENVANQSIKHENDELRKLLSINTKLSPFITEARVIGSDIALTSTIQIDVGSNMGINEGDIVVSGNYLVGKIIEVNDYSAKVLLSISSQSSIPSKGDINHALGLVNGNVGFTMMMTDILRDERIEVGEIVITSGYGDSYPPDLIVGTVRKVDSLPSSGTQKAEINALVDFYKLDLVYILRGQEG